MTAEPRVWRPRTALLGVVVLAAWLGASATSLAASAPGSTESLTLSATSPRSLGEPFSITAEGTADGFHRLFVYGAAEGTCTPWPYEEPTQKAAIWLSSPEGEPLGAGHFSRTYVATQERTGSYDVCAYLDATPSALPDYFESACLQIPSGGCYFASVSPAEVLSSEAEAKIYVEEVEAERKHRAESEQAEQRAHEEAAARQAREEAERRHAAEEAERRAREAKVKRCMVPQLRLHTLAGARRLLRDANCRLGRVTIHHSDHRALVVTRQKPQHGKALPHGAAVSIVLGARSG